VTPMAKKVGRGNVRPRAERVETQEDITGRQVIEFPRRRRPLRLPDEGRLSRRGKFILALAVSIIVAGLLVLASGHGPRR
jgi:hypothetical protein